MLIPIGFFGAGAAAGAYELISTAYGTGSSGVLQFSSIPQTYKHLQIRMVAKSSSTDVHGTLIFNGGGGTAYAYHNLAGNGSAVSSGAGTTQTSIRLTQAISNSTTANAYTATVVDILDYSSTSKNTTVRALNGKVDATNWIVLNSGLWADTSAITSLNINISGNYTTASRFSLYGIKG
jgi:hypothetical protein